MGDCYRGHRRGLWIEKHWGVAKLVKARDFDSRMRRFESCRPSHPTEWL